LLGRYPRGELFSDADLPLIISPPVATPAAVLLKRPDIQAALARAEAAVKLSSAADKALLPNLSLSGRIFKQSAHLNSLRSATGYWNILGSLFQPLFEGGRIISESRARHTEAEAALMELHEVVLNAVKEAEDAFGVERDLARQSQALKLAAHESEKSSRYYEERYRQGLDTILSLLMSKEQEMSVRIRLSEVAARRLVNRVDLALALGVGIEEPAMPVGDRTP
jgi:multidrug efflux system outer membrane protein